MASISITGIQLGVGNQSTVLYLADENLAAGECAYLDTDGEAAVADGTDPLKDDVAGIVLQDADLGNQVTLVTSGAIQVSNAGLVVGDTYFLSTTGDIQLYGDLVTSDYVTIIGVVTASDTITLNFFTSGAIRP